MEKMMENQAVNEVAEVAVAEASVEEVAPESVVTEVVVEDDAVANDDGVTEDAVAEDGGEVADAPEVDIDALIAEAEARGYERGRNEGIEAWMNEGRVGVAPVAEPESEVMILNNMRRSVWE